MKSSLFFILFEIDEIEEIFKKKSQKKLYQLQ